MNQNKKVLLFILSSTAILLVVSLYVYFKKIDNAQLNNVSIISSIINKDSTTKIESKKIDTNTLVVATVDSIKRQLRHFELAHRFTNFETDSNKVVLERLVKKLIALRKNKKGKIRIAYMGDSLIEGDMICQTLRKLLQKEFGGQGVGFVAITSPVAAFRQSVKHSFTANWRENNFKQKTASTPLFFSGKSFTANGYNKAEWIDNTITTPTSLQKYLYTGYKNATAQIAFNGAFKTLKPQYYFNKILIDSTTQKSIKMESSDAALPLYGISFETNDGIIIDNFSFRGLGGFEFSTIDTNFLKSVEAIMQYDLVIMQYGVNVLNNPNNTSFFWYQKSMEICINKLKNIFNKTDFLMISCADKAFKYRNGIHTAIGLDSLIATQEKIAFNTNTPFYNLYQSMGGYNSIIKWSKQNPPLSAKDLTHLSAKGAEILATGIFNAFMFEVNKSH